MQKEILCEARLDPALGLWGSTKVGNNTFGEVLKLEMICAGAKKRRKCDDVLLDARQSSSSNIAVMCVVLFYEQIRVGSWIARITRIAKLG